MDVDALALACKTDKRNISALWLEVYRLIVLWALPYCEVNNNRYELDDLTQSGYFALLKAVDAYTADCGYKFTTYLNYHCRNEFRAILGIRTSKREPVPYSLDGPVSKDTDMNLADTVPDERAAADMDAVVEAVYNEQLHKALEQALQTLPDDYHMIIKMLFYQNTTRIAAANKTGFKYSNVCRIEYEALKALRRGRAYVILKGFDYRRHGLKRTGFSYFKDNMESSVEAAVIKKLEYEERYKGLLDRRRSGIAINQTPPG